MVTRRGGYTCRAGDPSGVPLRHELGATYFNAPGCPTGSAKPSLMVQGGDAMLVPSVRERLEKKIARSSRYALTSRPLWLAIDIDHHFATVIRGSAITHAVIKSGGATGFDRIVVQHVVVGAPTIAFEKP